MLVPGPSRRPAHGQQETRDWFLSKSAKAGELSVAPEPTGQNPKRESAADRPPHRETHRGRSGTAARSQTRPSTHHPVALHCSRPGIPPSASCTPNHPHPALSYHRLRIPSNKPARGTSQLDPGPDRDFSDVLLIVFRAHRDADGHHPTATQPVPPRAMRPCPDDEEKVAARSSG